MEAEVGVVDGWPARLDQGGTCGLAQSCRTDRGADHEGHWWAFEIGFFLTDDRADVDRITARDPIQARITDTGRQLAAATGTTALDGLAGRGAALRQRWDSLTLDRQHAIVRAVLDYAVIAPGTPGAHTLDINRVQPRWRI